MEKKSFLDKIIDLVMKMSGPLAKFARYPIMRALQEGMMGALPMLMVGSVFVLLGALTDGGAGFQLFGFLQPIVGKLYVAYTIGIGFMGLYVTIAVAASYAKIQGVNVLNAVVLATGAFIALSFNDFSTFGTGPFGQTGMVVGIIAALVSVKIYAVLYNKNLVIKLPDAVPANVANSFIALIPTFVVILLCWAVRTLLEFDILSFITSLIVPILKVNDSWQFNFLNSFISALFWSVGLHYSNMVSGITMTLGTNALAANYEAAMAGVALTELPYVMAANNYNWYSAFSYGFSLIFLLWRSKAPGLKDIAKLAFIPALFNIFEPLWFGLPVILNPILLPAFIIVWSVTSPIAYLFFNMGWVNRAYLTAPWASPCILQGFIVTGGDWRSLILIAVEFIFSLIVWYPFVKAYERKVIEENNERLAENVQTN